MRLSMAKLEQREALEGLTRPRLLAVAAAVGLDLSPGRRLGSGMGGPRHAVLVGALSGRQCMFVQGRLESEQPIRVRDAEIGPTGYVRAEIHGRWICVEGKVQGNLFGEEQVVIRHTATVRGDVTAPCVVLEDGARLQGVIDTDGPGSRTAGRRR